jgi:uncharacterized protein (TIGR04222 family)
MNPFDLRGPEFLVFYAVCGLVVLGLLMLFRHAGEPADGARMSMSNPYLIAYLRGGRDETLRVVTMSLIERDLLQVKGSWLETRTAEDVERVKDPLERAVLVTFLGREEAASLFKDQTARQAADDLGRSLQRLGLVADESMIWDRRSRLALAWVALWAVALIKIRIGLSLERPVMFLVVLASVLTAVALYLHDPRRTRRGDGIMEDLRTLFVHLKERVGQLRPKTDAAETTLLAAVFGLTMLLNAGWWSHLRILYPRGASSGGSWTSSGGGGCGSSCGGGGCGGGCGGCGG